MLLGCIFGIHQFYNDTEWNLGKYFSSILLYICQAVGALPWPFFHSRNFIKQQKNGVLHKTVLCLLGFVISILISIPILAVLISLLCSADIVFSTLLHDFILHLFKPVTVLSVLFRAAFGALAFYCIVCGCLLRGLNEQVSSRQTGEPLIALVCMGSIGSVYLFLGKGTLPEGCTYSSYARQGFFQLLLVMLSILMAGVTLMIWKPKFPLFRFGLVTVTIFYIGLVWAHPGSVIARDYVKHLEPDVITDADLMYLVYDLSADAAPAIASLNLTFEEPLPTDDFDWRAILHNCYYIHAKDDYKNMKLLNYNFSLGRARQLIPPQTFRKTKSGI